MSKTNFNQWRNLGIAMSFNGRGQMSLSLQDTVKVNFNDFNHVQKYYHYC